MKENEIVININVTKFPIIILANFRTGSSALAENLSKRYNLRCFSEPSHSQNIGKLDSHKAEFIHFYIKNFDNNFVIKFMPNQICEFNPYEEILSNPGFLIKLQRQNKVEQISSLYVSEIRKKFFKLKTEKKEKYSISINIEKISECCYAILRNDYLIKILPYKENLNLVYEDLGFISNTDHVLSDQPDNIEEIKEEVRKILRWRWSSLKEHLMLPGRIELPS